MNTEDGYRPAAATSFNVDLPSAARVSNWMLGGDEYWEIDHAFGERAVQVFPPIKSLALANRRWVARVVNAALDAGITQFIDLGSGTPSVDAVHDIVRRRTAEAPVVYVDNDPVAEAHTWIALDDAAIPWTQAMSLHEDLRRPESIFADPEVREALDLAQPLCVLMAAVLHHVGEETDVPDLLSRYRIRVHAGSWLAISHIANDAVTDPEQAAQVIKLVDLYRRTQNPIRLRDHEEIASWIDAWGDPRAPGVVHLPQWRTKPSRPPPRRRSQWPVLVVRRERETARQPGAAPRCGQSRRTVIKPP